MIIQNNHLEEFYMKYLITGGAGFIGSNYLHYLLENANGNDEIHNVDVLTYAGNLSNLKPIENKSNYFFHKKYL